MLIGEVTEKDSELHPTFFQKNPGRLENENFTILSAVLSLGTPFRTLQNSRVDEKREEPKGGGRGGRERERERERKKERKKLFSLKIAIDAPKLEFDCA